MTKNYEVLVENSGKTHIKHVVHTYQACGAYKHDKIYFNITDINSTPFVYIYAQYRT